MADPTDPPPLPEAEFRAALLDAISVVRVEDSRFYRLLVAGRCPPALVRRYAARSVRSAEAFCAALAGMIRQAPDAESRLALIENLMEEEGVFLQAGGLTSRPEMAHPALAQRFATSVGAEAGEDDAEAIISPTHALLADGDWLGAVAHLLIGQELRFAENAPRIGDAFVARGAAARDVAFFQVHASADARHGEDALAMVVRHARTRGQQDHCIAEAHRGARVWIEAHGGLA